MMGTPRLGLVGILFATLLVFHQCMHANLILFDLHFLSYIVN